MDTFETPYEEEAEFIQCKVCEKSIKGESLYKIHLTTPGHMKKEDGFVAAGLSVRQQAIPIFENILQYLDYMKLDEPIIGLSYLEELPSDPQTGPRYKCKLCQQTANLPETVRHVIGRKHRQKYVNVERPDLVTWDTETVMHQGGKIIRARAEIIERQDGRGTPSTLARKRNVGPLNIPRAPPRQNQNLGRNIPQRTVQRDMPSYLPRLMDYQDEYYQQGRFPSEHLNLPPSQPEDPYMMRTEEDLQRVDYRDSDTRQYTDPDYRRQYEGEHVEDPQIRAPHVTGGGPRFNSREEMAQQRASDDYPEEDPFRRPYPQRDLLKEFYSEEVRRRQALSAECQPSQPGNQEVGDRHWPLPRDSVAPEGMNRADFLGDMRKPHQEETIMNPGPSRVGPPQPPRRVEVGRTLSDIPEPFRRFLKRPSDEEEQNGKRKRKSRFSDATAEEVETTKEMFSNDFGPQNPKFGGHPRHTGRPGRPEIHEMQHTNMYIQSQSTHQTEINQAEDSDSGGVFDMLKNIEIENAEEANFLKGKLCDLLKEFKNKKSQKATVQNSQGRAAMSKDMFNQSTELAPKHRYEPGTRQDSDHRRPEELYYQEDHRGRGREYEDIIPEERPKEYNHPVRGEPRQSIRSQYEEDFGWQGSSRTPHASHPDEAACYPERFQEARPSRDYRPAAAVDDKFLDSQSPAPPTCYDRGLRMDRGPRYLNNLDKITSTLLELVSRK
ncbi:uncharacterized protein si:ch211-13c6.2 isoform X2 [Notolabrus celidotus]|uniref:uncharacterized protein si:ch211-13c6.2 isoform X2 n=1 Tax=Notolabrus celidotus TaxID=1203425 RepID=UPI0014905BF9|nr:uncharacterized protein si:ch211-13c6.2 isoform X2 [Notolabrus celidotus]